MIDVIIPAYNAHHTIIETLSSILIQSVADWIKVTIVNDGGENYHSIVDFYCDRIDIQEFEIENGGPGVARQFGLEVTNNPFVVFIDSDDVFSNTMSIAHLYKQITERENIVCVNSKFSIEKENKKDYDYSMKDEFVWVFGNIYRRSFLEKNKIKFPVYRSNEDYMFNLQVKIFAELQNKIIIFDRENFTYVWKHNPNSITRKDDEEYTYFEGAYYVIKGKIDVYKRFKQSQVADEIIVSIWHFYTFWETSIMGRKNKSNYHNLLLEETKKFYKTFSYTLDQLTDENWNDLAKTQQKNFNYYANKPFVDFIRNIKK